MSEHKFPYKWYLADGYPAKGIEKHGLKVFGTFICGGGSTMGYKLAGYEHLGGVEIDPPIADVYKTNHHPKYLFTEDIREFNKRTDLPEELYNLDLLDGSPPCSTFSMSGEREKAWGKEKKFREGQSMQTLDDLVFIYCNTIIKLQPKVFLLENVKGIIQGNAKAYSKAIVDKMTKAGYVVQVFCLNAASMGVPQARERVFFIGHKKEFSFQRLKLNFDEKNILFGEFQVKKSKPKEGGIYFNLLKNRLSSDTCIADIYDRIHGKRSGMNTKICHPSRVVDTLVSGSHYYDYDYISPLKNEEFLLIQTFPIDYNFKNVSVKYMCGMSVPPVMTAQIAHQIYLQWLSKL